MIGKFCLYSNLYTVLPLNNNCKIRVKSRSALKNNIKDLNTTNIYSMC